MGTAVLAGSEKNFFGVDEYLVPITFGASSVASYLGGCNVTVVRNSAGNYTITLPQTYRKLLHFNFGFQDASGAILFAVVVSHTLDTDGKIIVETRTEAGTATDPTSGDLLFLCFKVSSDIGNDKFQQ